MILSDGGNPYGKELSELLLSRVERFSDLNASQI